MCYGVQSSSWVSPLCVFRMEYVGLSQCACDSTIWIGCVYTINPSYSTQCHIANRFLKLFDISNLFFVLYFILKWAVDSNSFKVVSLTVLVSVAIIAVFIVCEPGALMTKQFEKFGSELYRCDWYALPIELRRMYLVFLSDTQNPIAISSYGGIRCERETSKKVSDIWKQIQFPVVLWLRPQKS